MSNSVDLTQYTHERDEKGNRLPVANEIEELGGAEVSSIPMSKSDEDKYLPSPNDNGAFEDYALMAEMFEKHITDPHPSDNDDVPYDEYTATYVDEDMHDDLAEGLFIAILLASGKDEAVEKMRNTDLEDLDPNEIEAMAAE